MAKPEDILDSLLSGELTHRQAVEQQPDMEDRLTVLGGLADELRQLPREQPDAEFRHRARMRLLQHVQETPPRRWWWQRLTEPLGLPGWASGAMALIVAGSTLTGAVSYASASALPDDALYPVKRSIEQVQLAASFSDEAKADTYLDLADRRAEEIAAVAPDVGLARLDGLAQDYGAAVQAVASTVQKLPSPAPQLLTKVQAHVASQATELEARSLNSQGKPQVQQTLARAEVVASNASDRVTLIAEQRGQPGPQDVHLAANAPAAATAVAAALRQTPQKPSPAAAPVGNGASGGSANASRLASNKAASGTSPAAAGATGGAGTSGSARTSDAAGSSGSLAGNSHPIAAVSAARLDSDFDHLWNQVAGAPFMAQKVRTQLELAVTAAKQDAHAGKTDAAAAELNTFAAQVQDAVTANQATRYTAARLVSAARAILHELKPHS